MRTTKGILVFRGVHYSAKKTEYGGYILSMKKHKIGHYNLNLMEAITYGAIIPDSNITSQIILKNSILQISFEENINNPVKSILFLFDKKANSCIALQELTAFTDSDANIALSDDFINSIADYDKFSYGRLCIAFLWEGEYSCCFIKSNNFNEENYVEENNCLGSIKELVLGKANQQVLLYYSKGGLLSIKLLDSNIFYKTFYRLLITDVSLVEKSLYFTVEAPLFNENITYALISRTTGLPVSNLFEITEHTKKATRNIMTIQLNLEKLSRGDFDAYTLNAFVGNFSIDISFEENFNYSNGFLSKIHHIDSDVLNLDFVIFATEKGVAEIQIAEHIYPYMFSIIMAVYNTEYFLRAALNSIIAQKLSTLERFIIGNKCSNYKNRIYQNIYQVILVDDGSTDASGEICDEYVEKYEHFSVIHKKNGGVSSARNAGIKAAEGKYLNFMDSDDKFSDNVLSECFSYFEEHYDETNIITFPIKFFDASTDEHWLNDKFSDGKRIINMLNEHNKSLMFVNASIFKSEVIKNKIWFDENLQTGEDVRFIYTIFFKTTPVFGVINTCTYWYRRRSIGEASAIQEQYTKSNYYFEYLSDCLDWLLSESKKTYNFVPHYVQYLVAQQLQWRFITDQNAEFAKSVLNDQDFIEYKAHISKELRSIDTDIILEQKRLFIEHKKYILETKFSRKCEKFFDGNDISYYIDSHFISKASHFVRLEFLVFNGNELYIEGYNRTFEESSEFYLKVNGEKFLPEFTGRDVSSYSLGENIYNGPAFVCRIQLDPRKKNYEINFFEKIDGIEIRKSSILYHKRMSLTKKYYKSYYAKDGWGVRLAEGTLKINNLMYSDAPSIYQKYEDEFAKQVLKLTADRDKNRINAALQLRSDVIKTRAFMGQFQHKRIWLISDRINVAGDNGEAFFRYMVEKDDPDIEMYFVINEGCADYERLKRIGNVVAQNSRHHKLLHSLAEYIISSQGEEYIFNPFHTDGTEELFRDLISIPKFIFLQHGIIKDDLSNWLSRFNKNIKGFITAAYPEYRSILEYNYNYSEKEVWLTGLPRHDRLYCDEKRYITIMPTWRFYLTKNAEEIGEKNVINDFTESNFFKFYNALLNNEKLLSAAEESGYTITFMPHPYFMDALHLFDHDPRVFFFGREKPYREIFAESNLIMTDYSSSVMDFAYLRKPIVYCHFDSEEFFSGKHTYEKGYFDYERDGFGEVTYNLESVIDLLIEYMKSGCVLKKMYENRMDKFFAFNDRNNCERLYQKLKENK